MRAVVAQGRLLCSGLELCGIRQATEPTAQDERGTTRRCGSQSGRSGQDLVVHVPRVPAATVLSKARKRRRALGFVCRGVNSGQVWTPVKGWKA